MARRMGSTFTEGAITQHLSKLRNKMAELNVVPVPEASKRGSVTNKPSSVYAQKGRAALAPPQPVASKTQARNVAATSRVTKTAGQKRSARRKTDFIKRSESDDGRTDDEFDGGSDDDFDADRNLRNKRQRGVDDAQGQARRQVSNPPSKVFDVSTTLKAFIDADVRHKATTSEAQQARINQYVDASIENMASRGLASRDGQLLQNAGYEEEEEDDQAAQDRGGQVSPSRTYVSNPFAIRQDQVSPMSISRMVSRMPFWSR